MTEHYNPSNAAAENLFISPPEHRPFIDLSMVRDPEEVPVYLQASNTGATRWGNLILGIAIDGAVARGVAPKRIAEALNAGNLIAHADILFDRDALPDDADEIIGTGFEGSLFVREGELVVRGGPHGKQSIAILSFKKDEDGNYYVPHQAAVDVRGNLQWSDLPQPLTVGPVDPNARAIPPHFEAADRLGDLEELVGSDMFVLRGDVLNVR